MNTCRHCHATLDDERTWCNDWCRLIHERSSGDLLAACAQATAPLVWALVVVVVVVMAVTS